MARTPAHIRVVEPSTGPLTAEGLFRRFGPYVATIGMRILGRRDLAEDLVQDVFYDVHQRLPTLRDPNAARAWLARIAVRKATRQLRRRRVREWVGFDDIHGEPEPATPASQEQRVFFVQLYRELDRLPDDCRVPWVLRKLERMPLADVALACGVSLATVKRKIATAQAALDKLYNP